MLVHCGTSSQDGRRCLNHQLQQGADWSQQLFSSRGQEAASAAPAVGIAPQREQSQLWDQGHLDLPHCSALCVSQHAQTLLGAAHGGLELLLLSQYVYMWMIKVKIFSFIYFIGLCLLFSTF